MPSQLDLEAASGSVVRYCSYPRHCPSLQPEVHDDVIFTAEPEGGGRTLTSYVKAESPACTING